MKFLALLTLIAAFPLASRAEEAEKLDVPGLFEIEAPLEGYRWEKKKESDVSWEFVCVKKTEEKKEGLASLFSSQDIRLVRISVTTVPIDQKKYLRADYNFLQYLVPGKLSDSEVPSLEPKDPSYLTYTLRGKDEKTGDIKTVGALYLFGKYHYTFHYFAKTETEDKSKEFFESIVKRYKEQEKDFELLDVPGEFSVRAPERGYKWKKASEQNQGGVKAAIYSCTKEGSKDVIVLSVQKLEASLDSYRRTQLKASVNGMGNSLRQQSGKNPNIKLPSLDSPIPDRVTWYGDVEVGVNDHLYFHSACVFGKNVYGINVCTRSDKDSLAWVRRISDSFKEVPRDEKNRFVEAGLFSIGLPGEGYKWEKSPQQGLTAYLCKKEGSEVRAILNFIEKPIADKESKEKLLDHFIKFRKEQLAKDRSMIVDFQEPSKEGNYPEINHYSFKTKSASGRSVSISCVALFLNHTYILEVTGPEKDNPKFVADQLINSLRELKEEADKELLVERGIFSVKTPWENAKWTKEDMPGRPGAKKNSFAREYRCFHPEKPLGIVIQALDMEFGKDGNPDKKQFVNRIIQGIEASPETSELKKPESTKELPDVFSVMRIGKKEDGGKFFEIHTFNMKKMFFMFTVSGDSKEEVENISNGIQASFKELKDAK